jgi:hypothetical protein
MKVSLEETASPRNADSEVNVVLATVTLALGAAECAAMHTLHFADSVPLG